MPTDISPGKYIIVPFQAEAGQVVGMIPTPWLSGSGKSLDTDEQVQVVPDNYPEYSRLVRGVYFVVVSSS